MSLWFIIAQVLGVITIVLSFISFQIKNKRKYLLIEGITSTFWAAMVLCMGFATTMSTQLNLFIVGIYSASRAFVFWWIFAKDTPKRKRYGKIFLMFMLAVAVSLGIYRITQLPTTTTIIIQSITLLTAIGFVIGQYLPGKHPLRISVFLYSILLFINSTPLVILDGNTLERWNIMGMLIETSKIMSVFVFYGLTVHRQHLVKKLMQIKTTVNCEVSKIKGCSNLEEISDIMPIEKLERLAVKMVQYELSIMERDKMNDIRGTQNHVQAVLDDMKTVHDVKMMIEKTLKLKMRRLESLPIPKFSNIKEEMKEVILGKPKNEGSEEVVSL